MIGSQNHFFALVVITIGLRLLAQTALAGSAPKPLLAVACLAVLTNLRAATVIAFHISSFYNHSPR